MGTTLWSYPSEPHGRAALLGLLPRAAGRLAGLAVLFLAAACSGDEALTEPESGSRIATPASPAGTGDVRLLMSSPGLRWFQSHTHGDGKLSLGHPLLDQVAASGLDVSITGPTDLDHRFPGLTSLAEEINASGQIAGSRFLSEGAHTPDAIRWNANGSSVVLHKRSPNGQAFAKGLNDAGVVVGADNEVEPGAGFILHAMRWNPDGSFAELPRAPRAVHQQADAINNRGVIVGYAELADGTTRAVRWDAQGARLLATRGFRFDAATAINNSGTVVGYVGVTPAKWSPSGALTTLALPPGDNFGFATAINNRGQIVGTTGFSNGPNISHHAVIWAPDGHPSVLPFSESTNDDDVTGATAINDHGVIAGQAEDPAASDRTLPVLWFKGRRIFVPAGASARAVVNDLNADRIAGSILLASDQHVARWSFSLRFRFHGFFPPVMNPGPAPYKINRAKAGQPIPVRFSLEGSQGLKIFAAGNPASKRVACAPSGLVGSTPIRMGAGGLSYDAATDRYQFVWQTEKSWSGTCRQLSVLLVDGTLRKALFRFTP